MKSLFSKLLFIRRWLLSHPYRTELLISACLASIANVTLGHCLCCEFVNYDDDIYAQNINVQGGIFFEHICWAFTTTTSNHWHPLTWISLQCDWELFGENPTGYHFTNLLLHTLNVVLLFWLLRIMTARIYPSAVVAALFSVHPLHVESVAWVTERKDVLSTFFLLLTLLAYVRYTRTHGLRTYLLVVCFFILGLLAKPMLITLPGVMFLLDYWPLRRISRQSPLSEKDACVSNQMPTVSVFRIVWEKLPLIAIAASSTLVSLYAREHGGGLKSGRNIHLEERVKCALLAETNYLSETFWPVDLTCFYPMPDKNYSSEAATFAAGVLLTITIVAVSLGRTRPYLIVGWLFYLVTLFPVSGLVQLGSYARADRYTYVPLIGIFILLVWGISDLLTLNRFAARFARPVTAAVLAACMILSWQQVWYWHDSIALWQHSLAATRDNYFARIKLGQALQTADRSLEAHEQFQEAVRLRPDLVITHTFLGKSFLGQGQIDAALVCFREAVAIDPHSPRARRTLEDALKLQLQNANKVRTYVHKH